jgi:hypothetical protein
MPSINDDLDRNVWGAIDIAVAANLVDERGKPRVRTAYHLLSKGLLPATKVGKTWVSTPRRLRSIANGQATP